MVIWDKDQKNIRTTEIRLEFHRMGCSDKIGGRMAATTCVYKVIPNAPTRLAAERKADVPVYEMRTKALTSPHLMRVCECF